MGILKGFSESLAMRGIETDLKVVAAAGAGTLYALGSQSGYVQLASDSVAFVLDWDVVAGGLTATDILLGAELQKTDTNSPARLRPLAPGDLIKTDALESGAWLSAKPNDILGINPATGKLRIKLATDKGLFRIASDGGADPFVDEGAIWAECMALALP